MRQRLVRESRLVKLLENVQRVNQDPEVVQLARRILVSIGVSQSK